MVNQSLPGSSSAAGHGRGEAAALEKPSHRHAAAFTSNTVEWETPQDFYERWDEQYQFDLDVAATAGNAKAPNFYTKEDDGLSQPWEGNVWCNPPYGKEIIKWVERAYHAAQDGATVVMLVPARTDTRWWHDWAVKAKEIHFIRGRIKFGGSKWNAPFPSAVLVFQPLGGEDG